MVEDSDSTITEAAARLIGSPITSFSRIVRGGNNRLFRAETSDGARYAVKVYFSDRLDSRDRLGTEYSALTFLQNHSVEVVPRTIGMDRSRQLAVYEFIDGRPIPPNDVSDSDVKSVVKLLVTLKRLSMTDEVRALGLADASEACFSAAAIVAQIEARMARLERAVSEAEGPLSSEALEFVRRAVGPCLQRAGDRADAVLKHAGSSFDIEIKDEQRTLSPSDYGFHNALRRPDGQLAFLDFEYFGWDDPAKTISDFLLHPAMTLSATHKRQFLESATAGLDSSSGRLVARILAVYPLWALKWCLILLNEFVPEHRRRRQFAGPGDGGQEIRKRQLDAARRLLTHAKSCLKVHQIEGFIT